MQKKKNKLALRLKKNRGRILLWCLIVFLLALFPFPNPYFQQIAKSRGLNLPDEYVLPPPPPIPIRTGGKNAPDISAKGVLIKDLPSGLILFSKDETAKHEPASTTKIITALVILDQFKPDDIMTVKTVVKEGRVMGLVANEKITVESLLYGILVHSANDAAWTLAENYPGGMEKFVEAMNEKAKSLALVNTHFTNPAGFDDDNQYTTATDLAKLAQAGLSNKYFTKIVGTKSITVSDVDFINFHELRNVNELLGKIPGVAGVKTGFTQTAGEILVTEVKKNGQSVLFVLLKSSDRFGETQALIGWVFGNFIWQNLVLPTVTSR